MRRVALILSLSLAAAPVAASDLSLTELIVKQNLKAGAAYNVALRYQGDPKDVMQVCFLWSGEGPYCWTDFRVDGERKLIRTQAFTRNPNTYRLTGFVRQHDRGESNRVSKTIRVAR